MLLREQVPAAWLFDTGCMDMAPTNRTESEERFLYNTAVVIMS